MEGQGLNWAAAQGKKEKQTKILHLKLLTCWLCMIIHTDYNLDIFVIFILKMRVNDPARDDGHDCNGLHRDGIINPKQIPKYTTQEICNRIIRISRYENHKQKKHLIQQVKPQNFTLSFLSLP